jgi:hypothetical protein
MGTSAAAVVIAVIAAIPELTAAAPFAYIGPGAGLGMLGALFAVLAFVFLALLGPLLYPIRWIRRWLRHRAGAKQKATDAEAATKDETAT